MSRKIIENFLLVLLSMISLMMSGYSVSAQTISSTEDTVEIDFKVSLELDGASPIIQEQISYDIVHYPTPGDYQSGQVIYEFRSGEMNSIERLTLAPGEYKFRLYDGGNFIRNEQNLSIKEVSMNQVAFANSNQVLHGYANVDQGFFNDFGNGTLVYDVLFEIDPTQIQPDASLDSALLELNVIFTDGKTSIEPSTESLEEPDGMIQTSLQLNVIDEQGNGIPNVGGLVNDSSFVTNELGQATIELVDEDNLITLQLQTAEGYDLSQLMPQEVVIESGQNNQIDLTLSSLYSESSEINTDLLKLIFQVKDADGQPINGATIEFSDEAYVTNEHGIVQIENVTTGEYNYRITELPEIYNLDLQEKLLTIDTLSGSEVIEEIVVTEKASSAADVQVEVQDQDGSKLSGVQVTLNQETIATDEQGSVTFKEIPLGEHWLSVTPSSDYQIPDNQLIEVAATESHQYFIKLEEAIEYGNVEISFQDEEGNPIYPVSINMFDYVYDANAAGSIIIEGIEANQKYSFSVNQLPDYYEVAPNQALEIEVKPNDTTKKMITLQKNLPKGEAKLQILNDTGQKISGVEVNIGDNSYQSDSQGAVSAKNLPTGTYPIELTNLPAGYQIDEVNPTEITINEDEVTQITLQIIPEKVYQNVTFKIVDQDQKAVHPASIIFNDFEYITNESGEIIILDVEAERDYSYQLSSLPTEYQGEVSDVIKVDQDLSEVIIPVERKVTPGEITLSVEDQTGQGVEGAIVSIDQKELLTDENGRVTSSGLLPGEYEIKLIKLPKQYQEEGFTKVLSVSEGERTNIELEVNRIETTTVEATTAESTTAETTTAETTTAETTTAETTTAESTTAETTTAEMTTAETTTAETTTAETTTAEAASESTTSTPLNTDDQNNISSPDISSADQARINQEAKQATERFVDASTGISILVNPNDAQNIVRLSAKKIEAGTALGNYDADSYEIKLLDRNNQPVKLAHISEVKVPTRPVNSQLKVVRSNSAGLSYMTFGLHNQQVSFKTQELGEFAVIYGVKSSDTQKNTPSNLKVEVEKSVEKKQDNLPGTGEMASKIIILIAGILLLAGFVILWRQSQVNSH